MRTHCLTGRQMEDELCAERENAVRSASAPLKEGAAVRGSGLQNTPGGCELDFHGVGRHSLPPTQLACSDGLILIGERGV